MKYLLIFSMINCVSLLGSSPSSLNEELLKASSEGRALDVKSLIDAGANANCLDFNGCAPLEIASKNEDFQTLKVLIAAGAKKDSLLNVGLSQDVLLFLNWYTPKVIAKENTLFGKLVKEAFDEYEKGRPELLARMLGGVGENGQTVLPDRVIKSARELFEPGELENRIIPDLRNRVPGLQINGLVQIAARHQNYLRRITMRKPSASDLRIDD